MGEGIFPARRKVFLLLRSYPRRRRRRDSGRCRGRLQQRNDEIHFFISRAGADAALPQSSAKSSKTRAIASSSRTGISRTGISWSACTTRSTAARASSLLLSPEYLKSPYCTAEWVNAMAMIRSTAAGGCIVFRVKECAPSGLLTALGLSGSRSAAGPCEPLARISSWRR